MPVPEEALLRLAIEGDREALTQLLAQHGPVIRMGTAARIPPRYRSLLTDEDVMQVTYIDAFLDISRFEPRRDGAFASWLKTLTERNLTDAIRMLDSAKRGGDRVRVDAHGVDGSQIELFDYLAGTVTSPSSHVAREEAKAILRRSIESLPKVHQQVVERYDLGGEPLSDVATALGRSPGAVLMLRARAHQRLRSILGPASKFLRSSA